MNCAVFFCLATLLALTRGEEGLLWEENVLTTGEVYSVYSTGNGVFTITLMSNEKYYVYWTKKDGTKTVPCLLETSMLPLNVLFLDAYVDEHTVYLLNSVSSTVFLHSFWTVNSTDTCQTLQQFQYTPKGKVVHGFIQPRDNGALLVSVVDSKRDWYFALLPAVSSTVAPPIWTQGRSLIEVDTSVGDTTGSPIKATPAHHWSAKNDVVVLLDKTGKSKYRTSSEILTMV